MMKRLLQFGWVLLTPICHGQIAGGAKVGGTAVIVPATAQTPTISQVNPTATANTIEANFISAGVATAGMDCETTAGPYTSNPSADYGVFTGVGQMQQIVAGLTPSTLYYCQIITNPATKTPVGSIPALTGDWGNDAVAISNAPMPAGTLSGITIQYNTAPAAGHSLTIIIFTNTSGNNFTATSSFTLTMAATTSPQAFTNASGVPATAITAGQYYGFLDLSGTGPGKTVTATTPYAFYLTGQTSVPAGSQAYTPYIASVGISAMVSVPAPGGAPQTATFTKTTNALPATTAIASLTYGTPYTYNSINSNNVGTADTFYNAMSNDGTNYFVNDDTTGWTQSGAGGCGAQYAMTLAKFTSISPLAGIAYNCMTAYGTSSGTAPDGGSAKSSGLFAMNGYLFMPEAKQCNGGAGGCASFASYPQTGGQIIASYDRGLKWNNYSQLAPSLANGSPTNPTNSTMFGLTPTNMSSCTFIEYGPDDGTYGYLNTYTQIDNANAYVYLVCNEGVWNGGGSGNAHTGGLAYYLARVARAKLPRLLASDYQWCTAGVGGDCSINSNWTSTQSGAVAMLSNPDELSYAAVNYIPSRNRYLLLTFYFPSGANLTGGGNTAYTVWLGYEAPHPWGPWTLINTTTWSTQGYYNPIPIMGSGFLTGLSGTVIFSSNFATTYTPYLATMTIN